MLLVFCDYIYSSYHCYICCVLIVTAVFIRFVAVIFIQVVYVIFRWSTASCSDWLANEDSKRLVSWEDG